MKRLICVILMTFAGIAAAFSQTVTLTFTARDGANRYLKLNRVVITNLTKSWQETIYYPDTVLIMQNGTGIDDHTPNGGFVLSQNNPNPFSNTTDVTLTVVDEGKVNLDITDVHGRTIETFHEPSLQSGIHQFRISLSAAGTYVMTARQNGKTSSIKMICNGGGGTNTIDYLGEVQTLTYVLKSNTNKPFNFGDQMKYVGYATINGTMEESQHISQAQGNSQTFTLQFAAISYQLPAVTTQAVSNILSTSATCGGNVTSDGGSTVTARGICWSTSQNPTLSNNHTSDGNGTGSFTSNITGLTAGTTYYIRTYATNTVGTAYGQHRIFTTLSASTVTTNTVYNITTTTATCGGNVTSDGGSNVTARGVCWSTSQNPTVNNSHTTDGSGTGSFTSSITNLNPATTYYVRAYATYSAGIEYGQQRSFTTSSQDGLPCPGAATVSDYDGNTYNTVQIGGQCWMKENLRTTHYSNGASIPNGGSSNSETIPYYYNNSSSSIPLTQRGYYYNGSAVMHGANSSNANPSNVQGICPNGWHMPSDSEWTQLTDYISSQSQFVCGSDNTYIARALASTTGWPEWSHDLNPGLWPPFCAPAYNPSLNNATGFSAVPAGMMEIGLSFGEGGAYFWSSTFLGERYGKDRYLDSWLTSVSSSSDGWRSRGLSVRCLRDVSGEGGSATTLPTVTTNTFSDITVTSSTCGGNVTSDGGGTVTARGVCWSTSPNPTIINNYNYTANGTGTGNFTSSITGLAAGTTYYVRAYASNSLGTVYGEQRSFSTLASIPTVTTDAVTNISFNSATCGGNVTSDCGATVTARGVCWSTSPNPTINDSHTTDGTGAGSFTTSITGLTSNTSYYIRAYATNSLGTAYGEGVFFTTHTDGTELDGQPCPGTPSLTDIDGNVYNTVNIGNQCWMKENLRTTHYASGASIPVGGSSVSYTNPYYYNNTSSSIPLAQRGHLYNWPAVMNGGSSSNANPSGVQGICPNGWHLPSSSEWTQLIDYVNSKSQYICNNPGNNAKALASTSYWDSNTNNCAPGNTPTTNNATGFSALPVGAWYDGYYGVGFYDVGSGTDFWSTTLNNSTTNNAYKSTLYTSNAAMFVSEQSKYVGLSVRCLRDETPTLPTVTTNTVSIVTSTTATCGGNVTATGGAVVTRGVCWSTSQNPIVSGNHTTDGTGLGNFTSSITGLAANTTYYVRAYATNSAGTAYGEQQSFTTTPVAQPCPGTSTITDYDGNVYNTVQIGTQCWMKENLRTTHYSNGASIPAGGSSSSYTDPYYYNYSSSGIALTQRGYLYNWPAVMHGANSSDSNPSGVQGACPTGWHVPSDAEWTQLTDYVSSGQNQYECGDDSTYIAKAMASSTGWNSSVNTCAVGNNLSENNATGFSAFPAGWWSGSYNSSLLDEGYETHFWSSSQDDVNMSKVYVRNLHRSYADVRRNNQLKNRGYSVRCLRDETGVPTVTTNTVSSITSFSATCGGNVTSQGGSSVTARGVCWSTSQNPTVSGSHTTDGTGAGSFTSSITGLAANTTYYVRAYATNSAGTAYGEQRSFTTSAYTPTVTTNTVSNITLSSATCGGNVTSQGGSSVTARGVCWSTSQNPTVSGSHTTNGTGTGSFTSSITGLTAGATYYVRAYATNSVGTAYGEQRSFTTPIQDGQPCLGAATVTDYDGNTYNTVKIGNQCWMKENLRTTHYSNGEGIPVGFSYTLNPYYYNYSSSEIALAQRGYLYNWHAMMHGASSSSSNPSGVQGVCPTGWHVPSDAEWTQLTNYVSSQSGYVCGADNTYIAKALSSTTGWNTYTSTCVVGNNQSANNATGFGAFPAGDYEGYYVGSGNTSYFWSATEGSTSGAWCRLLAVNSATVSRSSTSKYNAFSVRCLRDASGGGGSTTIPPTVTTNTVSSITSTSAICGGNVTATGSATVTARGVCWSTSQNPTVSNSHTTDGSGTGSFTSSITGLAANTTYYVRAYATNSAGTAYGEQRSFTTNGGSTSQDGQPCPGTATVTDYDGNVYNTVKIGNQCWMKENLRTTHYANGASIPTGSSLSNTNPYYYNYSSSSIPLSQRGYFYNWPAVMHGASSSTTNPSGVQGICPTGWHVPSCSEWTQLIDYVSSIPEYICDSYNYAKALASTTGWNTSPASCAVGNDQSANNAAGFSAIPAGFGVGSSFSDTGSTAYFWSSNANGTEFAEYYYIYFNGGRLSEESQYNKRGYSVRCVKN